MRTKRMLSIVNSMRNRLLTVNDTKDVVQINQAMVLLQQDLINELEREIASIKLNNRYKKGA